VGFEGPDGLFCLVAVVHIWWDLLMCAFSFVGDTLDVPGACFVVKYLHVKHNITCLQLFHDDVVGKDAMMISFCLEWLDKDSIGSIVVCKHDELVPTHGLDGEAAHVVGE
jgi:hypothetical protein